MQARLRLAVGKTSADIVRVILCRVILCRVIWALLPNSFTEKTSESFNQVDIIMSKEHFVIAVFI